MTEQSQDDTPEMEQVETADSGEGNTPDKNYEKLYSDLLPEFTRKSQELSEMKKANQREDLPEDEKKLDEWLEDRGYVRQTDLESKAEQMKNEAGFDALLQENPDLKKHEDAIRQIQKSEGGSFEELVLRYNFSSENKLGKAKSSRQRMRGEDKSAKKEKGILEMSTEEYEEWKKDNGVGYSAGLSKSG